MTVFAGPEKVCYNEGVLLRRWAKRVTTCSATDFPHVTVFAMPVVQDGDGAWHDEGGLTDR